MSNTWWKDEGELVKEQAELLNISPDDSVLIKGPPGSGKTNLLLLKANQLYLGERPNLHVVVFGSLLRNFIKQGGAQYKFPEEKVVTHAQLFTDILRAEGKDFDTKGMNLPAIRAERAKRLDALISDGRVGVQFEALLLDEAQDYSPLEIKLFRSLTEVLVATADSRQKIYDVEDCDAELLKGMQHVHSLKYHFRNGLEICRLADGLQKGRLDYSPMLEHSNYKEKDYKSSVLPKPGLSIEQQGAAIALQIKDQRFAYPDDLIGVLCPRNEEVDEIAVALTAAGYGDWITRANQKDFDASKPIWLSTLSAAKGLEFRAVHIAGLDFLSRTGGAQRRLIYTGVTRAKTALTLYWTKTVPGYLQSALLVFDTKKVAVTKQNIFGKS